MVTSISDYIIMHVTHSNSAYGHTTSLVMEPMPIIGNLVARVSIANLDLISVSPLEITIRELILRPSRASHSQQRERQKLFFHCFVLR